MTKGRRAMLAGPLCFVSRISAGKLSQMMVRVQPAPAEPLTLAHGTEDRMLCHRTTVHGIDEAIQLGLDPVAVTNEVGGLRARTLRVHLGPSRIARRPGEGRPEREGLDHGPGEDRVNRA